MKGNDEMAAAARVETIAVSGKMMRKIKEIWAAADSG
jgi:hypothetical protein